MTNADLPPSVIIVGFGLPGRFVAEVLEGRRIRFSVIEANASNARGAAAGGRRVVCGDARDPEVLRKAGIDEAHILTVTLPDEKIVLEVLHVARELNRRITMLARCSYTSTAIKAQKIGASEIIVEEQIVALEFARLVGRTVEGGEKGQEP